MGLYTIGAAGTAVVVSNGQANQNIQLVSDTKFGGMIRAGIKAGHFVAAVKYNAVPTSKNNSSALEVTSENAYLGIKVGVDIGGRR